MRGFDTFTIAGVCACSSWPLGWPTEGAVQVTNPNKQGYPLRQARPARNRSGLAAYRGPDPFCAKKGPFSQNPIFTYGVVQPPVGLRIPGVFVGRKSGAGRLTPDWLTLGRWPRVSPICRSALSPFLRPQGFGISWQKPQNGALLSVYGGVPAPWYHE